MSEPSVGRAAGHVCRLAFLVAWSSAGCTAAIEPHEAPRDTGAIAQLPLGERGVHYQGVGQEEQEPWGPSALHVADDGSFFIVDTAANQLIVRKPGQAQSESIDLGPLVHGARDVLVRAHDLFVLDTAAMRPHVVRYSRTGQLLDDYVLPQALESLVDGFLRSQDDRVLLHAGGVAVSELRDGAFSEHLTRYAIAGRTLDLAFPDAPGEDQIGHVLDVTTPAGAAHFESDHFVSSVRLLRVLSDRRSVWSMEEVTFDPEVLVDATAVLLDAEGRVLGHARLPVTDQAVFVSHPATVDANGNLFVLHTRGDGAEIVALPWQEALAPILAARIAEARERHTSEVGAEEAAAEAAADTAEGLPVIEPYDSEGIAVVSQAAVECRSRDQMIDKGFEYVNSATWVSSRSLDRDNTRCVGRGVPDYIIPVVSQKDANRTAVCSGTSPGVGYECIRSVPYDWGGSDTVDSYRKAMSKGLLAGDTNTALPIDPNDKVTGVESCSYGTDCSGFVTQAWDIHALYGVSRATTRTLPRYSTSLSDGQLSHPECRDGVRMKPPAEGSAAQAANLTTGCENTDVRIQAGDILLKAGSHVTMFRKFGTASEKNIDGAKITGSFPFHFEATQSERFDRAIYYYWRWSRFDGFEPRRFRKVCP